MSGAVHPVGRLALRGRVAARGAAVSDAVDAGGAGGWRFVPRLPLAGRVPARDAAMSGAVDAAGERRFAFGFADASRRGARP